MLVDLKYKSNSLMNKKELKCSFLFPPLLPRRPLKFRIWTILHTFSNFTKISDHVFVLLGLYTTGKLILSSYNVVWLLFNIQYFSLLYMLIVRFELKEKEDEHFCFFATLIIQKTPFYKKLRCIALIIIVFSEHYLLQQWHSLQISVLLLWYCK